LGKLIEKKSREKKKGHLMKKFKWEQELSKPLQSRYFSEVPTPGNIFFNQGGFG